MAKYRALWVHRQENAQNSSFFSCSQSAWLLLSGKSLSFLVFLFPAPSVSESTCVCLAITRTFVETTNRWMAMVFTLLVFAFVFREFSFACFLLSFYFASVCSHFCRHLFGMWLFPLGAFLSPFTLEIRWSVKTDLVNFSFWCCRCPPPLHPLFLPGLVPDCQQQHYHR